VADAAGLVAVVGHAVQGGVVVRGALSERPPAPVGQQARFDSWISFASMGRSWSAQRAAFALRQSCLPRDSSEALRAVGSDALHSGSGDTRPAARAALDLGARGAGQC